MQKKEKITAEERERRLEQRAEAAKKTRQASLQRERKLRQEKRLNVYDYLVQITGTQNLSVASLKRILGHEYMIVMGEDVENEARTIRDLIEEASQFEHRTR